MKAVARIQIANRLDELHRAYALVAQCCQRLALPGEMEQALLLLTEEVLSNIMKYGYADSREHTIEFSLHRDARSILLRFVDDGIAFDPTQQAEAELGLPVAEAPLGGLGLPLIKRLSERLHYQRTDGYNILSLFCAMLQTTDES